MRFGFPNANEPGIYYSPTYRLIHPVCVRSKLISDIRLIGSAPFRWLPDEVGDVVEAQDWFIHAAGLENSILRKDGCRRLGRYGSTAKATTFVGTSESLVWCAASAVQQSSFSASQEAIAIASSPHTTAPRHGCITGKRSKRIKKSGSTFIGLENTFFA